MIRNLSSEPFTRFGAFVVEGFVRDDMPRGGVRAETWQEMRRRLERALPKLLADAGRQLVGTGIGKNTPVERRQEAEQGRPGYRLRRLYLYAWTVSTAVPAHVAANADPAVLNGFLTWEDEEKDD